MRCGKQPIREGLITTADHRALGCETTAADWAGRLAPPLPASTGGDTGGYPAYCRQQELVIEPLGQDPALLLTQEGGPMAGVDLSTRDGDGQVVVTLRGQLDMAEAAGVAAALAVVAAREPRIIVDLAGVDFIDSSGLAALVRGRNLARQAGGELLLAAPQQQVLQVLTLTRLIDVFPVHATVAEAAGSRRVTAAPPQRRHGLAGWPRAAMRSGARALAGPRRQARKRAGAAEALPAGRTA